MNNEMNALAINGGTPVRTRPWPPRHLFGAEEKKAVDALFDRCVETGVAFGYAGSEEEAFCREFSEFQGGGLSDAVNSGTSATYVALRALEIEPFTEVIVPPITDPGGLMPVPLIGCIPIPADTAPGSFNTSAEQIEARITPLTSAIVVAHIAGIPCDMGPIMELANKHNLPVVEDCAQAFGAVYRGRKVGNFGAIAAFSTMFGKHLASGGQGGIVFTHSAELYQKARWMADRGKPYGLPGHKGNVVAALNHNSDELACTIGRVQLRRLSQTIAKRQAFVRDLTEHCRELRAFKVAQPAPDSESAAWFVFFTLDQDILNCSKEELVAALKAENVGNFEASYWHAPAAADWCRQRRVFGKESRFPWDNPLYLGDPDAVFELPNAKAADDGHIRLLVHENLGSEEASDVAKALMKMEKAFVRRERSPE